MLRIIKLVLYLVVFTAVAVVIYAYLAPLLGVDFSAPQLQIRIPLELTPE